MPIQTLSSTGTTAANSGNAVIPATGAFVIVFNNSDSRLRYRLNRSGTDITMRNFVNGDTVADASPQGELIPFDTTTNDTDYMVLDSNSYAIFNVYNAHATLARNLIIVSGVQTGHSTSAQNGELIGIAVL